MKRYIEIIIDDILDDFTSRERRDFVYLTKDAADNCIKTNHTISGSFAEGLVNYDDIDWIKSFYHYLIVDSERSAEIMNKVIHTGSKSVLDTGILIIDTEDCNPGFARLLVYKEQHRLSFHDFSFHNGKKYFNGKMFMGLHAQASKPKLTVKGPSFVTIVDGCHAADDVPCFPFIGPVDERVLLPCKFFPAKDELCFVSKSHEYSKYPDIEFRWSFSNFENQIIRKFTDIEFQLYFISKELYNTYIKSNDEDKTCISSYTIKTLMFYFREKHREEMKSESMVNLIKLFLYDMKHSLKKKYLPQYFIREYNMFDVLKDDEAKEVLLIIENIEKDLVIAILSCKFFGKIDSLITLRSIYQTVTRINDFNMKDNILKGIYSEKSFKHLKAYLIDNSNGQKICQNSSIKDDLDAHMYGAALEIFTWNISYEDYWIPLCLYFHCNTIFKTGYRAQVVENFKFLFERILALYLMGIVPENHQRHLMYLLIETLLHRLIHLTKPFPSIHVNDKVLLLFYYLLRKDKEKTSKLLENLIFSCQTFGGDYLGYEKHSIIRIWQFYPNSIFSNDVILTKYMKKKFATPTTASTYIMEFTPVFLYNYIMIQVNAGSSSKEATKKDLNKIVSVYQHELDLLAVLEESLDSDID